MTHNEKHKLRELLKALNYFYEIENLFKNELFKEKSVKEHTQEARKLHMKQIEKILKENSSKFTKDELYDFKRITNNILQEWELDSIIKKKK